MPDFEYELTIHASSEKDAEIKMKALIVFARHFNAKELERLAHVVKNEPEKIALARQALGL
jgi:hypothetical protein